MRKLYVCLAALLTITTINAQEEALLSDLLGVQPVEFKIEGSEEMQAEYQKTWDDQKAKTDDNMTKLNDSYKKEVASMIDNFNKVLEKTVEQDVKNEKKSMITRITTLTMTLKKDKKKEVVMFDNEMKKAIRELPKEMGDLKMKELEDALVEYRATIDKEYQANVKVLETFKKTEHLIKTEGNAGM